MKFKDVINKRRSIRKYEKKQVPKNILKELIKDAAKAPSAKNLQPWEFYVVCSKNKRDKFSKYMKKGFELHKKTIAKLPKNIQKVANEFYSDIGGCQNIIFVYTNDNSKNGLMGVSCAIENLMLSAVDKGLGTCWLGTTKDFERDINKMLGIKDKKLIAGILIGYPKGKPLIRKKKKLNEILRFK